MATTPTTQKGRMRGIDTNKGSLTRHEIRQCLLLHGVIALTLFGSSCYKQPCLQNGGRGAVFSPSLLFKGCNLIQRLPADRAKCQVRKFATHIVTSHLLDSLPSFTIQLDLVQNKSVVHMLLQLHTFNRSFEVDACKKRGSRLIAKIRDPEHLWMTNPTFSVFPQLYVTLFLKNCKCNHFQCFSASTTLKQMF